MQYNRDSKLANPLWLENINSFYSFIFRCVGDVTVCGVCVSLAPTAARRGCGVSPELELQTVVNLHVGAGKAVSALTQFRNLSSPWNRKFSRLFLMLTVMGVHR